MSTLIEWPWLARMRYSAGSSDSGIVERASDSSFSWGGDVTSGCCVRDEARTMEKRCLSFVATISRSSGNVMLRDFRARVFSYSLY